MLDVKLKVVPKPADNTRILGLINSKNSTILFKGKADHELRCGRRRASRGES